MIYFHYEKFFIIFFIAVYLKKLNFSTKYFLLRSHKQPKNSESHYIRHSIY